MLLLTILVTSHESSSSNFRHVIDITNYFKSPQQTALRLGLWVWPIVLSLLVIVSNSIWEIWYSFFSIGNGVGLLLLWCRKQDLSQDKHQKQLFVSEVIPTILFALLPQLYYDLTV